ncbi:MAG: hypothetical protein EBR52_08545 [Microbacteriaceae bacterium]|nr:hypothetical protein [Microbacteriaceae bacterium]
MFTNAIILVNGDAEPETALVGIGEPSDVDDIDERVFYYFESLDEIDEKHTDPKVAEYFTVQGVESMCFGCDYQHDMTMPYCLDDGSQTVLLCPDCMPG